MRFPFRVSGLSNSEKEGVKIDLQTQYGESSTIRYNQRDFPLVKEKFKIDSVHVLDVIARNYEGRSFVAPVAPPLTEKPIW